MSTNIKRLAPWALAAGDCIALLLFVFIGQRDHEMIDPVHPLLGLMLTGSEFILPWIIAGYLLRAFRLEWAWSGGHLYEFLTRTLNAWLVAGPIALLLRALVLGRAVIPTVFIVVALGLGGLCIFAWRLAFLLIWRIFIARPVLGTP
ncbi:MAG: DUF3054 domain-containing protein [Acidobacteriota bacterium]